MESLEASVISRLPLSPSSAGTRMNTSDTSVKTVQCCNNHHVISVIQHQHNGHTVLCQLYNVTYIEFILSWEYNVSVTLFFNIDSVVKPDPYDGPESLSVQTLNTLYHISSLLAFTRTRSLGFHEMIYHPPLLASILPFSLVIPLPHLYSPRFIYCTLNTTRPRRLICHFQQMVQWNNGTWYIGAANDNNVTKIILLKKY